MSVNLTFLFCVCSMGSLRRVAVVISFPNALSSLGWGDVICTWVNIGCDYVRWCPPIFGTVLLQERHFLFSSVSIGPSKSLNLCAVSISLLIFFSKNIMARLLSFLSANLWQHSSIKVLTFLLIYSSIYLRSCRTSSLSHFFYICLWNLFDKKLFTFRRVPF